MISINLKKEAEFDNVLKEIEKENKRAREEIVKDYIYQF